ncbi:unnamed protein product [Rhodiola kirilowii]
MTSVETELVKQRGKDTTARQISKGAGIVPPPCDVEKLCRILDGMRPEDVGLSKDLHFFKHSSATNTRLRVTKTTIYECKDFSLCIFFLPANAVIPLHNHPEMTVFSKLLLGAMHIKSFDWVDQKGSTLSSRRRLAKLKANELFTAPCDTSVLYPTSGGNMHQFTAITPCAVLDVIGPPYDKEDGRDCTFYRDFPLNGMTKEGDVYLYGWLEEIDNPVESEMDGIDYASSLRVTVAPSVVIPEQLHARIQVCFHQNASLGICQCDKEYWKNIRKGSMFIGVLLVVIILLFQGMKLLPTGRKSAFYLTVYGSLIGAGSFLLHHFSVMINSILVNFGLSEEMHNPISIIVLVLIVLAGAGLGYWIVRRYIVSEDGEVDAGITLFVKWAMRIVGSTFILQSTLDTPLAFGALIFCWSVCIAIHCAKSIFHEWDHSYGVGDSWLWRVGKAQTQHSQFSGQRFHFTIL